MTPDAYPTYERGCQDKANLGRKYAKRAEKLSRKHRKKFGVYRCIWCKGTHLTTKLYKASRYYEPLIYITGQKPLSGVPDNTQQQLPTIQLPLLLTWPTPPPPSPTSQPST